MKRQAAHRLVEGRKRHRRLVLVLGVLVSLALLCLLARGHLAEVQRVGEDVRWSWVWLAIACSVGSYVMVGLALGELLTLLGYALGWAELLGIALVSTTANYFVSSAGISGFALKAHLLRKRKVPYGVTVTVSVLSSAILYMVLAAVIGQGFIYLLLHLQGTKIAVMESAMGLLVLLAVAVPLMVAFFDARWRGRLTRAAFHWANRVTFLFSKSEIPHEEFKAFEEQLEQGLERVRKDKARLTMTVIYTCVDWCLCLTALFCSFMAVGVRLPVGHLAAGFTAGQAATLIPFLPGGLGVVEGSMAAVFQSLGIAWGKALVAVLLYRLAYYLVPGFVSVLVLWGLKVSEPDLAEDTVLSALSKEGKLKSKD
ncbi:MAG: flippase-like domain-containing protein [Elusimicrobia bacterium]|nr:flippase-like domain-containing protein [Elusimicrobiota bacterium]MDE2424754.1 flippase-like domain-containing protein [Elusimicrobiota bacterium]